MQLFSFHFAGAVIENYIVKRLSGVVAAEQVEQEWKKEREGESELQLVLLVFYLHSDRWPSLKLPTLCCRRLRLVRHQQSGTSAGLWVARYMYIRIYIVYMVHVCVGKRESYTLRWTEGGLAQLRELRACHEQRKKYSNWILPILSYVLSQHNAQVVWKGDEQ